MSQRIKMGLLSELPPGRAIEKQILARKVAVFNDGGRLIGLESECKHMRASLVKGGAIKDGTLVCAWHGWKYDVGTGECTNVPGFKLKKYDIELDGDTIYLLLP
ncbi:MAG: Rieske (2Fe-2S) protein [candidate division Zixibacteria bacterium]|nr:Rieske (2Fe-2S) protein [candidate division Zixibacteria bacterium]